MAMYALLMPQPKLVHGVQKTIIDPVTVVGNGTRETRRKQNRYPRIEWRYPARSILNESKWELYKFFSQVGGSQNSFVFIDPEMPWLDKMPLLPAGADTWQVTPYVNYDPTSPWYAVPFVGSPYFFVPHSSYSSLDGVSEWTVERSTDYGTTWVDCSYEGVFMQGTDGAPNQPITWYMSGYPVGTQVRVTGANTRVGRLNSTLSWSVAAMEKGNGTCNPVPTIVDMADISIIEVFETYV